MAKGKISQHLYELVDITDVPVWANGFGEFRGEKKKILPVGPWVEKANLVFVQDEMTDTRGSAMVKVVGELYLYITSSYTDKGKPHPPKVYILGYNSSLVGESISSLMTGETSKTLEKLKKWIHKCFVFKDNKWVEE